MLDIFLAKDNARTSLSVPPWLVVVLQNTESFMTTVDRDVLFGL